MYSSIRYQSLLSLGILFLISGCVDHGDQFRGSESDSLKNTVATQESVYVSPDDCANACQRRVDSITQIKELPYVPEYSGDPLYWRIVCDGLESVPFLIEKLGDSSSTLIGIPVYGGDYALGDVALCILQDIIYDFPTLEFIPNEFHDESKGSYFVYIEYTRAGFNNRKKFQKKLKEWYANNSQFLTWCRITYDIHWPVRHPCGGCFKRDSSIDWMRR